jgi:hypothetical protein
VPPTTIVVGTATLVTGVVGLVRQVDSGAHPCPPPMLLGPAGMRGSAVRSAVPVREVGCVSLSPSEALVGATVPPQPPIAFQSRTWARAISTRLSLGVMGRGGLDGVTAHAGGRSFLLLP